MNSCNGLPCWKFVMASLISLSTTIFACVLLFLDKFQNTALTAFATSTISSNIVYWTEPPKFADKTQRIEVPPTNQDII